MIYFRVDGKPQPKQRPRVVKGHAFTPKETADYEQKVRLSFLANVIGDLPVYPSGTPVMLCVCVHKAIPKNFSKKKRAMALSGEIVPTNHTGDLDNILKSIADALQGNKKKGIKGFAYEDDCQLVKMGISKVYSEEDYCVVAVGSLEEVEEWIANG